MGGSRTRRRQRQRGFGRWLGGLPRRGRALVGSCTRGHTRLRARAQQQLQTRAPAGVRTGARGYAGIGDNSPLRPAAERPPTLPGTRGEDLASELREALRLDTGPVLQRAGVRRPTLGALAPHPPLALLRRWASDSLRARETHSRAGP